MKKEPLPTDLPGFEFGFDVFDPAVLEAVDRATFDFCQATLDTLTTDLGHLRRQLAGGLEGGETYRELTNRVSQVFGDRARADRIARTESTRAMHQGEVWSMGETGVVEGKTWLASADACFRAGTKIVGIRKDGSLFPKNIEDVCDGDLVLSGKLRPKKVLRKIVKHYRGSMVCGQDFSATPDHHFLSGGGWVPIRNYVSKALPGGLFDLSVGEPQDIPSALFQVVGLPSVFPRNFGFGMPVNSVAKNDKVQGVDNKINNPFAVHGDLLSELNAVFCQQLSHGDFNVGSFCGSDTEASGTMFAAIVAFRPTFFFGAAGKFSEVFPASETFAGDAIFPIGVGGAFHPDRMRSIGTSTGAERDAASFVSDPFGSEQIAARAARYLDDSWDAGVSHGGFVFTCHAAKPRASFKTSWRNPNGKVTKSASDKSWGGVPVGEKFRALDTTEQSAASPIFAGRLVGLEAMPALFCQDVFQLVADGVAGVGAELSAGTWFGFEDRRAANASHVGHDDIVQCLHETSEYCGDVFDLEIEDDHSFVLSCGLIAHNCPLCLDLNGKTVGLDEPFVINGAGPYAVVMHPPRHPNCFCSLTYSLDESALGLNALEQRRISSAYGGFTKPTRGGFRLAASYVPPWCK